jgi:hypothetical protein
LPKKRTVRPDLATANEHRRAARGNIVRAVDRELGERDEFGAGERERELLQLGADHGHFHHAGRHVEVEDGPAPRGGEHL